MNKLIYKEETCKIKAACIKIKNELRFAFLEKVYENALCCELSQMGFKVRRQYPIKVTYQGKEVGNYYADIFVDDKIIIELKAVNNLTNNHKAQLLNYLKPADLKLGLLINFNSEKNTFNLKRIANLY